MNSKNIYLVFTLIFINSLIINGQITKRPVFTKATYESLTISKANLNCKPENVVLTANATSYCKVSKTLNFAYQIDYGNNGSFEVSGTGNSAIMGNNAAYSFGSHKIKWIVTDACGGFSTCTKLVTINNPTDTIKPTAIAKVLGLELLPTDCKATLEYAKANNNSFDNCTVNSKLRFRLVLNEFFNPNINIDEVLKLSENIVFDNITGTIEYILIVIDENNNWNYTKSNVIVQNNFNPDCAIIEWPFMVGFVNHVKGQIFDDTSVVFKIYRNNYLSSYSKVDKNGLFPIGYQGMSTFFKFQYENNLKYKDLSNNDIAFLDNYLKNKATFSNNYARLAADINQDHVIDNKDLELLKNIVNQDSTNFFTKYIFLQKDYIFKNAEPEKDILPDTFIVGKKDYKYYLKAIKLGDIYNNLLHQPIDRSNDEFVENQLFQNQPNPFNDKSTIYFNLASNDNIVLNIFDNNGKQILSHKQLALKGLNQIEISSKDFPNDGVYFYQIITSDFIDTKKMMIIK